MFSRVERPNATYIHTRRLRRRGPRSLTALHRRSHNHVSPSLSHSSDSPPADDLCQSRSSSAVNFDFNKLSILQCNLRGWISHHDELEACLQLTSHPSLIFLNEILLDASIAHPVITGYELVGRHEKSATKRGIAVFAIDGLASDIVLLFKSIDTERMWFVFHS